MIPYILGATMIVNPGHGTEYIVPTADGYNVIKLGEQAGVTQVIRTGNVTNVVSPEAPTQFIYSPDVVDPAITVDE